MCFYAPATFICGMGITPVCTYILYVPKMVYVRYLLKTVVYNIGFILYTQVYNHKIQVKFSLGYNPRIIMQVMAFLYPTTQ